MYNTKSTLTVVYTEHYCREGGSQMRKLRVMNKPEMEPVTGYLMRHIAKLTSEYEHLLPYGWRSIIRIYQYEYEREGRLGYELDLCSNQCKSNSAKTKMETLEKFPELCTTGGETINDVKDMIQRIDQEEGTHFCQTDQFSQLIDLPHPALLKDSLKEWLQEQCGISISYGGIRIPFTCLPATPYATSGEILITFNGTREWQDSFFAMMIFTCIQNAFRENFRDRCYTYNLEDLKKLCETRFWIDILDIKEV